MGWNRLAGVVLLWVLLLGTVSVGEWASAEHSFAPGTTYYVSIGGKDSNVGSAGSPWATIEHAGQQAQPGDSVLVRGGVYNEGEIWLQASHGHCGEPGKPLTIRNFPGEEVVLENGERPFIVECDHIRVEGFQFRNGKSISVRGTERIGIQIVGNTFTDAGYPQYGWDAISSEGSDVLIEGNVCDIHGNTKDTQGHCFYVHHGRNIVVRNNVARGATGYGIHIFDQRRGGDPPDFRRSVVNVTIEGNLVAGSEQRSGIIIAATDEAFVENVSIRNNIVYGNAQHGILVRPKSKNITIDNNTLFGNGEEAIYISEDSGEQIVDGVTIRNNILDISAASAPVHISNLGGNATVSISSNLYWPPPMRVPLGVDAEPVLGDPSFLDPAQGDFHLRGTSPAIDAGLMLAEVTEDKDGVPRPQGSGLDIGALEYVPLGVTFVDVPPDHWAHDYIEVLFQNGCVAGCQADPPKYCPEAIMTRAESAVFVVRGLHGSGFMPPQPAEKIFEDVLLQEWFANWATQLWEDGYTAGCGVDPLVYCPFQEHTRAEGAVFFLRMQHGKAYVPPDAVGLFTDVLVDAWYARWAEAAYAEGLLPTCAEAPELRFCPEDPLDRAMAAFMMVQAKGLEVK